MPQRIKRKRALVDDEDGFEVRAVLAVDAAGASAELGTSHGDAASA